MADQVQVAANVRFGSNARFDQAIAGAAITVGMPVYLDPTVNQWKPCVAGTQPAANCKALAASSASGAGQPLLIVRNDPACTIGFATIAGQPYFVSVTASGIIADAKPASANYSCFLGIGKAGNLFNFEPVFATDVSP